MGKFINCRADGNEIGFVVSESSELDNCIANENSKYGFLVVQPQPEKELEFYKQNAAQETAALLIELKNKTESESREIIAKSSLVKKLSAIKDPLSIIASILSISANPNAHEIVNWLLNHIK